MGNAVLIDSDIVAVSASAAAEERFYSARGQRFKTKKEMKEALGEVDEEEIERIVEPAPFSHARQNARMLIQSILDAVAPVSDVKLFLSGPNNFRYDIATIKPYKGNRDKSAEPIWRKDVEEWLIEEYGATRTNGYEADDAMAVEFCKNPEGTVLCSQDKDFMQLPKLRMYNWYGEGKHVQVSLLEAARNFYKQLLIGDVTDNIEGCRGIGKAKAEKAIDRLTDPKLMMTACYILYQKEYGKDAWAHLEENARLIFLCRTEKHLENPRKAWVPIIRPAM